MTNPHPAFGGTVSALVYNQLFMPGKDPVYAPFTIASGQTLKKGAVLGLVSTSAAAALAVAAAAVAGNTGNGTCTVDATPAGTGAKAGVWRAVCIEPATNGGTFAVEDPEGVIVGRAVVGTLFAGPVRFTIADGATDFVAGDAFTLTVTNSSGQAGKLILSLAAATDGSEEPFAILTEDLDTTAGDKNFSVAVEGYFNETALVYGTGHDANSVRVALREKGIYLKAPRYSFA